MTPAARRTGGGNVIEQSNEALGAKERARVAKGRLLALAGRSVLGASQNRASVGVQKGRRTSPRQGCVARGTPSSQAQEGHSPCGTQFGGRRAREGRTCLQSGAREGASVRRPACTWVCPSQELTTSPRAQERPMKTGGRYSRRHELPRASPWRKGSASSGRHVHTPLSSAARMTQTAALVCSPLRDSIAAPDSSGFPGEAETRTKVAAESSFCHHSHACRETGGRAPQLARLKRDAFARDTNLCKTGAREGGGGARVSALVVHPALTAPPRCVPWGGVSNVRLGISDN